MEWDSRGREEGEIEREGKGNGWVFGGGSDVPVLCSVAGYGSWSRWSLGQELYSIGFRIGIESGV